MALYLGKKCRRILAGTAAGAACLLLSGCGLSLFTSVNERTIELAETTDVSMSWWGNDPRHKYTLEGLSLFETRNPDLSVRSRYGVWNGYERRINVWMESGTETDVMQVNFNWLSKYSPEGEGYYDLNLLTDVLDLSTFSEKDLIYGTRNGHLNALPIAYNTTVFFYNQTMLDKYGLEVPRTWEDLYEAAKVLREEDIYTLGVEKKMLFLMLIAEYEQRTGKHIFAEDGSVLADQEAIESMLTTYKKIFDAGVIRPLDDFSSGDFEGEKIAGIVCWISDSSRYCNSLAEKGTEVSLGEPVCHDPDNNTGWYIKPATMYAISESTPHPQEAGRLLNFLLNDPEMAALQGTEKGIPVSKAARKALTDEDLIDDYAFLAFEQMQDRQDILQTMIPVMEKDDTINAFKNASDKYLYDQTDIHKAAEEILEAWTGS